MAERPEVAIQAILARIRDMQQLNMQLADHMAMVVPGGPGVRPGRTTWDSPGTDPPLGGGGTAGMTSPSGSEGL